MLLYPCAVTCGALTYHKGDMMPGTNYAVTIDLSGNSPGRPALSLAVVHGASDKYEAIRIVRAHGYKPVASIAVREVSDEVAALAPYPMWK